MGKNYLNDSTLDPIIVDILESHNIATYDQLDEFAIEASIFSIPGIGEKRAADIAIEFDKFRYDISLWVGCKGLVRVIGHNIDSIPDDALLRMSTPLFSDLSEWLKNIKPWKFASERFAKIIELRKASEEKDGRTISTESARIVIVLSGGLITDVYSSNRNVSVEIIDFDVQDSEEVEAADKAMNEVIADVNNGTMLAVY